jgi:radical SAM superfamily enzyme YgiQ (UPF0313 family)
VRGEGEITFRDLLRAIESGSTYDHIEGLSYRVGDNFLHNRERPISGLDKSEIRPPNRSARVLSGYTMLGRQIDVIETSRGCTFDCSFCSIKPVRLGERGRRDRHRARSEVFNARQTDAALSLKHCTRYYGEGVAA